MGPEASDEKTENSSELGQKTFSGVQGRVEWRLVRLEVLYLADHVAVVEALDTRVGVLERRAPAVVYRSIVRSRQRDRTRRTVVVHLLQLQQQPKTDRAETGVNTMPNVVNREDAVEG